MMNGDVLLIDMPFCDLMRPSLAHGQLKAGLLGRNIESDICCFNLLFAKMIGVEDYKRISDMRHSQMLIGEWIFAKSCFGTATSRKEYISEFIGHRHPEWLDDGFVDLIIDAQEQVEPFIERCLSAVDWKRIGMAFFTLGFSQNQIVAALSLAKRIKGRYPSIIIEFSGRHCLREQGLELIRQFSWVDVVVSGEGDFMLPELVVRLKDGNMRIQGLLASLMSDHMKATSTFSH